MIVNRALKRKIHNNAISYQPNRKQKLKKKKKKSTEYQNVEKDTSAL